MSANVYVTAGRVLAAGVPRPPLPSIDPRVNLRNVRHNLSNLYAFSVNCLKAQSGPVKEPKHGGSDLDIGLGIYRTDQGKLVDAVAEAMEEGMSRAEQSDSEDEDGYVAKGFPSSFIGTSSSRSSTPTPAPIADKPHDEGSSSQSSTTEPFPDYYESCETGDYLPDPDHEQQYEYAVFMTAQEANRFRAIDARIACSPIYLPEYLKLLHGDNETNVPISVLETEAIAQGETIYKVCKGTSPPPLVAPRNSPSSETDEETPNAATSSNPTSPQPARANSPRSYFKWEPNQNPVPESTKIQRLTEMRLVLCHQTLKPEIRLRFLQYAEAFVSIERTLFADTELNRRDFLGADVLAELETLTQPLVRYIAHLSQAIYKEHCAADQNREQVRRIFHADAIPSYQRYADIAGIMIRCVLPPPPAHTNTDNTPLTRTSHRSTKVRRDPDRELLICTLRLFEALVYDDFLIVRQHQNLHDDDMNVFRVELCRIVVGIWSTLGRIVMDYERWVDIHEDTHRRYVGPAAALVLNPQQIWDEEVRQYEYEMEQAAAAAEREREAQAQMMREQAYLQAYRQVRRRA
ncbi:hypothetical protein ATEIFO6365_0008009800 [Aspergillus terreus]|uniref:Uncharacterized protein n=1 Tax=Aspergillus terreus TaxID=33178 RepID=A0A5M3Z762_ASPTE|nr:hypothetical protein ATETN484_0010010700 [Aspergillus terreus]GFF18157.1 hypothetical protein ATEIFO6365_0008009800 [Aspergillus terreus]